MWGKVYFSFYILFLNKDKLVIFSNVIQGQK
jgi:hypothetical protein